MIDFIKYFGFHSAELPANVIQNLDQGFENPAFLQLGSEFTVYIKILVSLQHSEFHAGRLALAAREGQCGH